MQCPGQDSRYWDGEAIFESHCPKCGGVVEFFKDDSKRRCRQCGHELVNPRIDFGCASYCPFAEQCLGGLSPEMLAQKQDLLIDRVALSMKRQYGEDFAKIGRASRTARYAGTLAKSEEANKAAVTIAALLAELDGPVSGTGHRETTKTLSLLTELQANEGLINEVCTLIKTMGNDSETDTSTNTRVLHDAWRLEGLAQSAEAQSTIGHAQEMISAFKTVNGRHEAESILAAISKAS
ncbi:MAG: phosphohydrolase [Proteobacteria bacterium]|nr:phosphohydrolase [Pseudomonadota bacterium]MDP2106555.1 phosphohydrolase [Desulfobulbaceae bacterium]